MILFCTATFEAYTHLNFFNVLRIRTETVLLLKELWKGSEDLYPCPPSGTPVSNVARPWPALAPCTTTASPTTRPTPLMVQQSGSCVQSAQRGEDIRIMIVQAVGAIPLKLSSTDSGWNKSGRTTWWCTWVGSRTSARSAAWGSCTSNRGLRTSGHKLHQCIC